MKVYVVLCNTGGSENFISGIFEKQRDAKAHIDKLKEADAEWRCATGDDFRAMYWIENHTLIRG